jgi:hypothetical protein
VIVTAAARVHAGRSTNATITRNDIRAPELIPGIGDPLAMIHPSPLFRRPRTWLFLAICGFLPISAARSESWKVTVDAGSKDVGPTPVIVPITEPIAPGNYRIEKADGSTADAQVFREEQVTYLALNAPDIPAGSSRTFTLVPEAKAAVDKESGVTLTPDGTNVAIKVDGKLFTEYRTDEGPKPFLFPLNGPGGTPMTRAYPMKNVEGETRDHPHHRSLWFTYGRLNGIDFWAEPKGKPFGSIKEIGREPLIQGPVLGRLHTRDQWVSPSGVKVCEDERILTIYHTKAARIFDFDITIKATEGPVEFSDTKEGMFGVRVASTMDVTRKQGGKIVTSEGLVDDKAWGKPAAWVDYSGPVAGKTVGIAILNHPESFRYPTTWHVRNYGLFAANPFGWHDFGKGETGTYTIPQGKEIRFRYRVILHTGDAESAHLPRAFQAYTEPPRVTLSEK